MADIRRLLTIRAPAASVYRAITQQDGLRAWWTLEAFARPEVGAIVEFRFGDRYRNKMRILRLDPENLVEWEGVLGVIH